MSTNPNPHNHDFQPQENQLTDFINQMNELTLFGDADQIAHALTCPHVWSLEQHDPDGPEDAPLVVRCIFCDVSRILGDVQRKMINQCVSAGIQFVKWPARARNEAFLAPGLRLAIAHAGAEVTVSKTDKRRARKRLKKLGLEGALDASTGGNRSASSESPSQGSTPSAPRESRVQMTADVPAGYGPVADVAAMKKMEPKKLRKMIRDGKYKGVKVGANIYALLPTQGESAS